MRTVKWSLISSLLSLSVSVLAIGCGSSSKAGSGTDGAVTDAAAEGDAIGTDGSVSDANGSPTDSVAGEDTSADDVTTSDDTTGQEDAAAGDDTTAADDVTGADDAISPTADGDEPDADTVTPGDTGPATDPQTCNEALDCIGTCGLTPSCVDDCIAVLPPDQAAIFGYLEACAELNCGGLSSGSTDPSCLISFCTPEVSACATTNTDPGPTGTCDALVSCMNSCLAPSAPESCQTDCVAVTAPSAVDDYNALLDCVFAACSDAPDIDACVADSQMPGGACEGAFHVCEGGSAGGCGECFEGTTCGYSPEQPFACASQDCGSVDGIGLCTGASGQVAVYCDPGGMLVSQDCVATAPSGATALGCTLVMDPFTNTEHYGCPCSPACAPGACGDDGCGGTCGCGDGETCDAGVCTPAGCVPNCNGAQCGDDGCNGSCGSCPGANDACDAGQCLCQPVCNVGSCGDDSCGGTCPCGSGETCSAGTCTPTDPCVAAPTSCACLVGKCQPSAAAALCAGVSQACQNAIAADFQANGCTTCGAIAFPGLEALCKSSACAGDLNNIELTAPAICDSSCLCTPSCGGKICGDDGCGGSCGGCGAGKACSAGQCVNECSLPSGRPLFCSCASDDQCDSAACISVNNNSICTHECSKNADCEAGSGCNFSIDFGQFGGLKHFCTP